MGVWRRYVQPHYNRTPPRFGYRGNWFRDHYVWERFKAIAPELPPDALILSLGCSEGHEAYSAAITMFAAGRTDFVVLGVDIDTERLREAKKGCGMRHETYHLPDWAVQYFTFTNDGLCVKEEVKQRVAYLWGDVFTPPEGLKADVVILRYVGLYYTQEGRERLAGIVCGLLKPRAVLMSTVGVFVAPSCEVVRKAVARG